MKRFGCVVTLALLALLCLGLAPVSAQPASSADPGWPRLFEQNGHRLTVYQPQVDSWANYAHIQFRSAIALKKSGAKEERFGVLEVEADTVVNERSREVTAHPTRREIRFANLPEAEEAGLRQIVDQLLPQRQTTVVSLDRVLAYLDPDQQPKQPAVEVNMQPPKIFYSSRPAILLIFMGEPEFKPVDKNRTDLMFAVNANWDVLFDTSRQQYYLLNGSSWLKTGDPVKGPWTAATSLPAVLSTLPATENWKEVRAAIPAKPGKTVPVVIAATEPAELILTEGEPRYTPIAGTKLMQVANSGSPLFLHNGDKQYYFLVAGRWFRAKKLEGSWSSASDKLPSDFARIPDNSPAAFVKASVPGTQEAKDAVLLASVPTTTSVSLATVEESVSYDGEPSFSTIEGTTVKYAVNTPAPIFWVDNGYYWCNQGTWLYSATYSGPWAYAATVPAAIYTIPPSHPMYNVTYVRVQTVTPTTVVYSQTSGYSGEYVAATGVVMFGMGLAAGAIIANNYHHYYPPCYYSYGRAAVYNHGYGGYVSHYGGGYAGAARVAYGPYGGAARTAAYNPRTGTYARGAYAAGPGGSAGFRQAYNPRTGGYAERARVNTAYGSAGRFYAERDGKSVQGGSRSGAYGSAAGVRSSTGAGAAAWDTARGQGAVVKDRSGDVYAGRNGNVYKKEAGGTWNQRSGGSWQPTSTNRNFEAQNYDRQAQARSRGNAQSARASQARASAPRQTHRGGGGGGGRRR